MYVLPSGNGQHLHVHLHVLLTYLSKVYLICYRCYLSHSLQCPVFTWPWLRISHESGTGIDSLCVMCFPLNCLQVHCVVNVTCKNLKVAVECTTCVLPLLLYPLRSLVALSLVLSLLLFKPAPLYILDEVDAALDLSHTQVRPHMQLILMGMESVYLQTKIHTRSFGHVDALLAWYSLAMSVVAGATWGVVLYT